MSMSPGRSGRTCEACGMGLKAEEQAGLDSASFSGFPQKGDSGDKKLRGQWSEAEK